MLQFNIYPNKTRRIVTFSYDDGHEADERLIALFNQYGVKATFHLNGLNYIGKTEAELDAVRTRYRGHEIACHTLRHGWPADMSDVSVVNETMEDRKILERIAGYPVVGMSYPSGSFNEHTAQVMHACGILYSRTTRATDRFALPDDFLRWHPTCHHRNALGLCPTFLNNLDSEWYPPLFYIWGHSHEFHNEADWNEMETLVKTLAGDERIWYATNLEIYNYKTAQRALRVSADERILYNPTDTDIWVEKDKADVIYIPAGQTITL